MDQFPLVSDQIDDGRKVVAELIRSGFPVTAACWIKTSDDDSRWSLYIASPVVSRQDPRKAYLRIHPVIWHLPPPNCVHPHDIRLISAREPLAKAVIEARESHPGKYPAWVRDLHLGPLSIDGAYIYPAIEFPDAAAVPERVAAQDK